jgi:hypothetical protein
MNAQYEPGRYWGQITNQELSKSSTGNPQIVISFRLVGRVNLSDPEGELLRCPDGERRMFRSITDKTIEYVLDDLQKLGFNGTSFSQIDLEREGCIDLRSTEHAFMCAHEEYNGKVREKWSLSGDFKSEPLPEKEARQLDALFGAALRKRAKQAPAAEKPQPKHEPVTQGVGTGANVEPRDDSDIPW